MTRAVVLSLLVAASCGCRSQSTPSGERIPATTGELKLDGELGEPDWSAHALRHVLAGPDGGKARPFSETSFLHDKTYLYVGLYAADENIQSGEFFDVHIGALAFHANATGTVTPEIQGAKASIDRDGTLDDPSNDDEEWVLELAIPLQATGFAPGVSQIVTVKRCDTPKDHIERCGTWSGRVALE
ncbi:MAG: hypothetical protein ABJE66_15100 [Deltaproteobacteria bacterium]